MSLFKNILKLLLVVGLLAYMAYAFIVVVHRSDESRCESINIVISDSLHAGFVSRVTVENILRQKGVYPVGQYSDSVNCYRMQKVLTQDNFIQEAVCYKTGRQVNVIVRQRIPVLRIMADNGSDYYLDEKGFRMSPRGYEADLVVVTGNVDETFAAKKLVPLGLLIRLDDFWDGQIEQIYVTPNKELELFTRIGDQTITAGRPDKMRQKLSNLKLFYQKVMPEVGWNHYKEICIAYDNQVIGRH